MKVLFLPRWFPVPFDPFWGLFVLNHARAAAHYHEVIVLYVDKTDDVDLVAKSPFVEDVNGAKVMYLFYRSCKLRFLRKVINTSRMLIAWRKGWGSAAKQFGKPDVVHVNVLTRLGAFALLLKKRFSIPYVITEHWSRYLPKNLHYKGTVRKWVTKRVVAEAAAVMPVTRNLELAMKGFNLTNTNYVVVPNVIDASKFIEVDGVDKPEIQTLIHISTFDNRAKNISGILRVAHRLIDSGAHFKLRMIGDGADRIAMEQYALQLGLPDTIVKFEHSAPHEKIPTILAEADLLLLFSNYENIPVVINEAFAAGVPVVATDVGGIAELVNDSNGLLVPPGDEDELFETLDSLIKKGNDKWNRSTIQKQALESFSFERVGKTLSEIYEIAVNSNN